MAFTTRMVEYKKQHYLPASYLSNFSDDPAKRDRKSFVWRIDGEKQVRVPVESQCYENFFYSKDNPEAAEKSFHPREAAYCRIMQELKKTGNVVEKSMGDLFLYMFDLNLRNANHKNQTENDGFYAYQQRLNIFLTQMLVNIEPNKLNVEAVKLHITTNWRMEIVHAADDSTFVTSDNPSVFMTCTSKNPKPHKAVEVIMLPLDPQHLALAFDRRFVGIDIKPKATVPDTITLNLNQIQNSERCIFSDRELDKTDLKQCRFHFSQRKRSPGYMDEKGWRLSTTYLKPDFCFEFMKLKPPLF